MKICVTGGSGMVGNCIRKIIKDEYSQHEFIFLGNSSKKNWITSLDLTDRNAVMKFFEQELSMKGELTFEKKLSIFH